VKYALVMNRCKNIMVMMVSPACGYIMIRSQLEK
jgi:hypothetical protein